MINYGYFRHRFDAHQNPKLNALVDEIGVEAYAYYYTLLELYGSVISKKDDKESAQIHIRVISNTWRKRVDSCKKVLTKLQLSDLLVVTFSDSTCLIEIPNFLKYYGSYQKTDTQKTPNKRKENKIKINKIKENKIPPNSPPISTTKKSEFKLETEFCLGEIWNEYSGKLPKVKLPLSGSRSKKAKTRLKDHPDKQTWIEAISRASQSNFCNGINDRGWVATLNWLLQNETVDKILDGTYDNRIVLNKSEIQQFHTHNRGTPYDE